MASGSTSPCRARRRFNEEKVKWPLEDLTGDWSTVWTENHPSAKAHPEALRKQFAEDFEEGLMLRMKISEAKATFGDRLVIAACGGSKRPAPTSFGSFSTVPTRCI